jgi:squalene-hopene/tetraprenyl-beta-curcumene cyclase
MARPDESPESARGALEAARTYLLSIQGEDGHWCGELEGDTILESEYILTMIFLGRGNDPRVRKAAESLRRQQLDEGGWSIYPGGPAEPSASVKAYFVLKYVGDSESAPHMERARRKILALGGVEACNSFTKTYLAMFRQYDWNRCPAVPPEMILLPKKFIFNIYEMSSWSRAIVVPLSIIWALKPTCTVPEHANIPELFVRRPGMSLNAILPVSLRAVMTTVFHGLDRSLKVVERLPTKPLRNKALERAERWILRRLENSDGLGAIFPPIVNTIFALRALGYAVQHPVIQQQVRELEKLIIEEEETLRVQPCFSPVWDTALAVTALLEAGPADDPAVLAAARWLLGKEVKQSGDWEVKVPGVKPGGWYFEYANEYYPDCDDTAEVLTGLSQITLPNAAEDDQRRAALDRALDWVLAMQNKDGGWGAFDRNCNMEILTFVPFADHNAMIDPSCEDITGRVLEALSIRGFDRSHPAVRRGVEFLLRKQEADGTWFGRWGCNYIYGTWLALRGLEEAGVDLSQPRFRKAAAWLRGKQNDDGGWGELPHSYDDPQTKGQGPSTAAQTAWALMGLFATGDFESESVRRGIRYLEESQFSDGSWHDEYWTGTGFPSVFYLRYHLYAIYFPLQALATYLRGIGERGAGTRLHAVAGETV